MFDELVRRCDVIQMKRFGKARPLPPCLKCLINSASRFDLSRNRYVVTADKENSGVDEHKLPQRKFRRGSICGVSRDRTTLRQYCNVDVNIGGESHFNNVMNAGGS